MFATLRSVAKSIEDLSPPTAVRVRCNRLIGRALATKSSPPRSKVPCAMNEGNDRDVARINAIDQAVSAHEDLTMCRVVEFHSSYRGSNIAFLVKFVAHDHIPYLLHLARGGGREHFDKTCHHSSIKREWPVRRLTEVRVAVRDLGLRG